MSQLVDLVETIDRTVADLEAALALPAHETHLYAAPPAVSPEICPLLAVYASRIPWRALATGGFYVVHPELVVEWWVPAVKQGETLSGDDLAEAMRGVALTGDEIAGQLATYAVGVPGQANTFALLRESELQRGSFVVGVVHRLEVER